MNSDQLELVKQLDNKISKAHGTENEVDKLKAERAKLVKRIEELKDNERIKEELERTKKVFEKHNEDTDKIESELAIKEHMLKALQYREIREAEARIKEIDEIIKEEETKKEKKEDNKVDLDNIKKPDDLIKSQHLDETKLNKKKITVKIVELVKNYLQSRGKNKNEIVKYSKSKLWRDNVREMFKIIEMINKRPEYKNETWLISTNEIKKEAGWEEEKKEDDKPLKIEDLKTEEEPKKEKEMTEPKKEEKEKIEEDIKKHDDKVKDANTKWKSIEEYNEHKAKGLEHMKNIAVRANIDDAIKKIANDAIGIASVQKRSDYIKLGKSNEVLTSSPIYKFIKSWVKYYIPDKEDRIKYKKYILSSLNSHFYFTMGLAFYDVKPKEKNITDKTITPKKNDRFRIVDRLGFLTRAKKGEEAQETKIKEKKKKLDVVSEKINKPFFSFDINKIYWIVENVGNVVLSDRGREDLKDLIQNEVNNYNNTQYFIKLQKLEKGKKRIERRKAIQEYIRNNVKREYEDLSGANEVANHGLEKYSKVYENIEAYLSERAGENKTFKLSKVAKDNIKRIIESSEKREDKEGKNKVSIMDKINSFHI